MNSDRPIVGHDLRELRAREGVDASFAKVAEARRLLEEAEGEWNVARSRLASVVQERRPRPEELVYGDAACACGACMAHWPDALSEAWECSAILLGRARPEDEGHDEPRLFAVSGIRTSRLRRTA